MRCETQTPLMGSKELVREGSKLCARSILNSIEISQTHTSVFEVEGGVGIGEGVD